MELTVVQLNALQDNYIYLVHDVALGVTAVVDPSVPEPVLKTLSNLHWKLDYILNTHHHWDHTGGNLELKKATGAAIVGPKADEARIPGIDIALGQGDEFRLGSSAARILDIPGHTHGHIAYFFEREKLLFSGDTLFTLGCGRLFEGTAPQMWDSLSKLALLPDETKVYCGHEYTQANAAFAVTIDPFNETLRKRKVEVDAARAVGRPTVPSTLLLERQTNPFLRAEDPAIKRLLRLDGAPSVKVFTEIRRRKDKFKY